MKRIISPMLSIAPVVIALTLGGTWTASAAQKSAHHTLKFSDAPAAVQKTVKERAGGANVVRMEKETRHGKTVYEAIVSKDGKETGIEVAPNGKFISTHDETREHKGSMK